MVKKNELRVGNWIADHEAGGYFQIEEICKVGNQYNVSYREGSIKCAVDVLDPIPLTEEWLVRFGFKKIGDEWRLYPSFEIQIIVFNHEKYNGVMFYTRTIHTDYSPIYCTNHINYVHQLQNLYFALRGQELEIKEGNNE